MKQSPPHGGMCSQWKAARRGVPPASETVYWGKQASTQTVITSPTLSLNLTPSSGTVSYLLRVPDAHSSIHAISVGRVLRASHPGRDSLFTPPPSRSTPICPPPHHSCPPHLRSPFPPTVTCPKCCPKMVTAALGPSPALPPWKEERVTTHSALGAGLWLWITSQDPAGIFSPKEST